MGEVAEAPAGAVWGGDAGPDQRRHTVLWGGDAGGGGEGGNVSDERSVCGMGGL